MRRMSARGLWRRSAQITSTAMRPLQTPWFLKRMETESRESSSCVMPKTLAVRAEVVAMVSRWKMKQNSAATSTASVMVMGDMVPP